MSEQAAVQRPPAQEFLDPKRDPDVDDGHLALSRRNSRERKSAERVLPISQRARMHFTRAENEGEQKRGPLRISDGGEVRIGITIGQLI